MKLEGLNINRHTKNNKKTQIFIIIGLFVLIIATLKGLLIFSGDEEDSQQLYDSNDTIGQRLTYFLIDGLDYNVFNEELAAGNLPELSKMIEDGVYIEKVITSFPSMTGYAFWPLITGYDATQSGVMGLRWWDRNRTEGNLRNYVGPSNKNMNLDTYPFPKTIYERINDQYSSTYQCYMNRGASSNVQLKWMAVVTKYAHYFPLGPLKYIIQHIPYFGKILLPNEMMGEEEVVDSAISDLLEFHPRVQWITFGTPDGYRHSFGEEEEDYYRSILRACDQQIGRYRKKCEEIGGEEGKRLIVVTSDHSIVNLQHHVNLEEILKELKLKVEYGSCASVISSSLTKPITDYKNSDGAIAVNGNTLLHVYFRDPIDRDFEENNYGWKTRKNCSLLSSYQRVTDDKPINIIEEIRSSDGIELVVCLQDLPNPSFSSFDQSQKEVHIYSKTGHSIIRKEENNIKNNNNDKNYEEKLIYIVNEGEKDALGWYENSVNKIEISHTADEWLNLTADWEFPYATVRLWRSINANSSGDLIITSLDKWDMAKEGYEIIIGQHKGGHGGLRKDQMLVPAIFSVASSSPSSPSSSSTSFFSTSSSKQLLKKNYKVKCARAEDVGATLMSLVGVFDEEILLAVLSSQNHNKNRSKLLTSSIIWSRRKLQTFLTMKYPFLNIIELNPYIH